MLKIESLAILRLLFTSFNKTKSTTIELKVTLQIINAHTLHQEGEMKAKRVAADVSLTFTNVTASVQK